MYKLCLIPCGNLFVVTAHNTSLSTPPGAALGVPGVNTEVNTVNIAEIADGDCHTCFISGKVYFQNGLLRIMK